MKSQKTNYNADGTDRRYIPQFNLTDMLASTGAQMTDLASRISDKGIPLTRRDKDLAATAITGTQLAILDELKLFVIAGLDGDVKASIDSLEVLMAMKADL